MRLEELKERSLSGDGAFVDASLSHATIFTQFFGEPIARGEV